RSGSFFFSSRRRHTRFSRDWSSDVCSSDLDRYDLPALARFLAQVCAALLMVGGAGVTAHDIGYVFFGGLVELGWFSIPFSLAIRSEERRGGRERGAGRAVWRVEGGGA